MIVRFPDRNCKKSIVAILSIVFFATIILFPMECKTNSPPKHPIPIASSAPGSSDPVGDEWSMFRDQLNHTGVTQTVPVGNKSPFWNYTTANSVESSPAVSGGRVYVGSDDHKVYCLDAVMGSYIWNYTTASSVESSPAVADGRVYVGSDDGNLYCLNAATGVLNWTFPTGNGVLSSPAVAGGFVYAGSADFVYSVDAATGALNWTFPTGNTVFSSPAEAG